MTKNEFLAELGKGLKGLPEEDLQKTLSYYNEMIEDRVEDGASEEEAVASLGGIDEIVRQTLSETPLKTLVKEKVKKRGKRSAGEIILLILGAPLWIPLLITALVLVLVFFILLFVGVIVLSALLAAFAGGGCAAIGAAVSGFIGGSAASGVFMIGAALVCFGLALLMIPAVGYAAKGSAKLCKKITIKIKSLFVGKEKEQ